jgi:Flp pilus assembly protein TadG
MTTRAIISLWALVSRFRRDSRAASAVEFAIVCGPFFFLLMGVAQVGIFYMTQSALDTGTIKTAEMLRNNFTTGTTAVLPGGASLKTSLVNYAGALINNNSTLSVEVRQLDTLSSGTVSIVDGTTDYGSNTSTLVLRAQAQAITFTPGLSGLSVVTSSAMVRRQGT